MRIFLLAAKKKQNFKVGNSGNAKALLFKLFIWN